MALRWLLAGVILVSSGALAGAKPAWQTVVAYDPLQGKTACLIASAQIIVDDGQTTTPVRFVYNGKAFLVTTESNIDPSYPDVGLRVDAHPPIPIGDVYKDTNVIFESNAAEIHTLFIRGSKAKLSLGFWPTWPRGETVVAVFSLNGFTRAHRDFVQCQQTGSTGDSVKEGSRP